MSTPSSPNCKTCNSWWRLPLLLAVVLAAVWLMRGRGLQESEPKVEGGRTPPAANAAGQTVMLTLDFGDGRRETFPSIPWREGMTVLDATRESPRENARMEVRGTGESAFVDSLDGVANEGAEGRNWKYSVNGKMGDRSSAIYELQPRDQVLWTFEKPQ